MSAAVAIITTEPPARSLRYAPSTDAAAPQSPMATPARTSARPRRAYEIEPTMAVGMMTGSGVPTATRAGCAEQQPDRGGRHDTAADTERTGQECPPRSPIEDREQELGHV